MSRLLEIVTPLGKDQAILSHLSGHESLGGLPQYNLTLITRRGDVKPADLLGKNVTIGIEMPGGQQLRYLNGYITQFADAGRTTSSWFENGGRGQAFVYHATLHPWLWFLTRASNFRFFQDKTIPEVIQAVCGAYPFAYLDTRLTSSYTKWEYCCQYRETDFSFISRLMEQEGIYYYFEYVDGKHTMILCDAPSAHSARTGYATIPYSETGTDHAADKEYLVEWNMTHQVLPGRFTVKDFDFTKPKADLTGTAANPKAHDLNNFEYFDYPGEYESSAEGRRLAGVRLEELHAGHEVVSAGGAICGIETGRTFKITDHPQVPNGSEYLVTNIHLDLTNNNPGSGGGSGSDVRCNFTAIPARTPFRPARTTARPTVSGPQTAIVVGPAGEEIFTDQHGRVKVQFHWDRYNDADEKSSCWVRVSQPWASKGWGAMFLPRIGHEVIVEFIDGDPDWPIITGRVYNGESPPPWALPANKTRSGFKTRTYKGGASNFNEISFEDKQGAEEIYMQAERNKIVRIKHDLFESVGHESHVTVGKDSHEEIKGDMHHKVKGDHNSQTDGSWSLKIGQDAHIKTGHKLAVDSGTEVHIKAGMKVVIEAGASLSLKVGGNFVSINPAGVFIKGAMVMVNSGGDGGSGSGASPAAPKPPKAHASTGGTDMKPVKPAKPEAYSPQAQALKLAWKTAAPFCAQCATAKAKAQG